MNDPVNLLVIDTSTSASVLGLQTASDLVDRTTAAVNSHSREILPQLKTMVDEAGLNLSDIDAFVFGQGPGSFTGLRIAAGVIQGLAYGLGKPVVQVSTMAALAQSKAADHAESGIAVALTARLDEVYFGAYRFVEGSAEPVVPECVADVSDLPALEGKQWMILGDYRSDLVERIKESTGVSFSQTSDHRIPRVEDLVMLGRKGLQAGHAVSGLEVSPVYLREEVASKPEPSKPGLSNPGKK